MKKLVAVLTLLLSFTQSTEARSLKKWLMAPMALGYLWIGHGFCLTKYERAYFYFDWIAWWDPENAG